MTPEQADLTATRIRDIWPNLRTSRDELIRALTPIADHDFAPGGTITGYVRAGKALTAYRDRYTDPTPPNIRMILSAINSWQPPRPPTPIIIATEDDIDPNWRRIPDNDTALGLKNIPLLRAQIEQQRADRKTGGTDTTARQLVHADTAGEF
jgi:hypothetical protein